MRIAVISDIHANLQALQAVADDLDASSIDAIWCLGDVVGYGGNPIEALAWVEERVDVVVKGNHDEAVASGDVGWFNPMAAQAARRHAQLLTPPQRTRVYGWTTEARRDVQDTSVLLVHASPDDPLREYVQPNDAVASLHRWSGLARIILLGHTHRPFAASLPGTREDDSWRALGFERHLKDKGDTPLLIVNPGSVGQPRDGDPRASYAILDFDAREVELRRVRYDLDAAAQAILCAGLDPLLATRLQQGR